MPRTCLLLRVLHIKSRLEATITVALLTVAVVAMADGSNPSNNLTLPVNTKYMDTLNWTTTWTLHISKMVYHVWGGTWA